MIENFFLRLLTFLISHLAVLFFVSSVIFKSFDRMSIFPVKPDIFVQSFVNDKETSLIQTVSLIGNYETK